jgi:hypothetical protein
MSRLSKPNVGMEEARPFAGMSQAHAHAAGVDVGAHETMVCVAGAEGMQIVRSFGSYTADLQAIGTWFAEHEVETVAMESTGVYWIPLFEELVRVQEVRPKVALVTVWRAGPNRLIIFVVITSLQIFSPV